VVAVTSLNRSLPTLVSITAEGSERGARSSLKRNEGCGNSTTCRERNCDGKHRKKWNVHPVTTTLSNETCFRHEMFERIRKYTNSQCWNNITQSLDTFVFGKSGVLLPYNSIVTTTPPRARWQGHYPSNTISKRTAAVRLFKVCSLVRVTAWNAKVPDSITTVTTYVKIKKNKCQYRHNDKHLHTGANQLP
jgi:hypothetical protein